MAKYDMKIDQGCSYSRVLNWKDKNKTAINTTGYTGKLQIRQGVGSQVIVELTSGNGITISNDGIITISLTPVQTKLLTNIKYVYDFIITNTVTGKVTKLLNGDVLVTRAVTL